MGKKTKYCRNCGLEEPICKCKKSKAKIVIIIIFLIIALVAGIIAFTCIKDAKEKKKNAEIEDEIMKKLFPTENYSYNYKAHLKDSDTYITDKTLTKDLVDYIEFEYEGYDMIDCYYDLYYTEEQDDGRETFPAYCTLERDEENNIARLRIDKLEEDNDLWYRIISYDKAELRIWFRNIYPTVKDELIIELKDK